MQISGERLDRAREGLRPGEGRRVGSLARGDLLETLHAAAAVMAEAKRVCAPLAAEVARRSTPTRDGLARSAGFGSAERLIAQATGGTLAEARSLIAAGMALLGDDAPGPEDGPDDAPEGGPGPEDGPADSPEGGPEPDPDEGNPPPPPPPPDPPEPPLSPVGAAFRDGLIGHEAAALIRETLRTLEGEPATLHETEVRLVDRARSLSLIELRRLCDRVRASHDAQVAEERERRQWRQRTLVLREEHDGMISLFARLDPGSAATVQAYIDAQTKAAFQRRHNREVDDHRTPGQIRLDALVALAAHGLGCESPTTGAKTTVVVHVGLEELRTGLGLAECDATGAQLTVGALRRMGAEAEVIPAVLAGRSLPLDLGRGERLFSRAQKLALAARDGGCAWCGAPAAWCDAHHIVPWLQGGRSDLENGVLLCRSCHTGIHDTGWEIATRKGEVWFVPPPDVDAKRRPLPGGRRRYQAEPSSGDDPPARGPEAATRGEPRSDGGSSTPAESSPGQSNPTAARSDDEVLEGTLAALW